MTEAVPLDGHTLTLDKFLAIVRGGRTVSLDPSAIEAVEIARRAVERAIRSGRPIYGVTTGFGFFSDRVIPPADARQLQLRLVRSHASGLGPPLSEELVRGLMLHRLNSLANGHSGVRREVLDRLTDLLNRRLVPFIPEQGSVGASGDLAPLAHLALAMIGEGSFVDPEGRRSPARDRLTQEGLDPLTLEAKEGVSILNGTSLMASYLALSVSDAHELLEAAIVAAAVSFDALEGDPTSLDPRLAELRHSPEERKIAVAVTRLIEGSELATTRPAWRGQDPYTLRCIPQVLGATAYAIATARTVIDRELNAVSDNPLVFEKDEFISGGNFHGQHLALALDSLALGVHYLGAFAERRVSRLVHPSLNRGLPPFLAPEPGLSNGLMIPQYVAASLVNENVTLVQPASAVSLPTSADQEDFVSMGAWAGAKLRRILQNVRRILAIEWMVGGQAVELRRPKRGGKGTELALRTLRESVAPWTEDRSPASDLEAIERRLTDGSLLDPVRKSVSIEL